MTPARPAGPPAIEGLLQEGERSRGPFLEDLQALVNVDCGTYLADGVNRVADHMQQRFESAGWSVERRQHRPGEGEPRLGDLLIARLPGGAPDGRRVLLVGHMDTVFPEGTVSSRPFRTEDRRAYGPGVSDMKGGLLAGFHAVSCLQRLGFDGFSEVVYVCNPDEEIGSPWSGPIIAEVAREADVCFVLEGARENGDIVSSRKGVADLRITVHGRAAHAGVEPERGRSATLQAALSTVALHALNGMWPGVTVNVGVLHGGTRPNVMAERCELHVDVRGPTAESFQAAVAEVERIARAAAVPEVRVDVERRAGFPPMERTQAIEELAEQAKRIAAALGFELRDAATGGASDANPVAGMGVPTLDGLGPVGGGEHSPREWLDLDSVVPRTALLAALITDVRWEA